ncbi:M48 family metallopeptidase [Ferrimonas lipolytica]|uniref:M48 family metallopeptidase n=1 Tax=Ferrimonas lipolytica TaxID=2724191 RepID=A0A6H1UIV7_9GAMM|nr:YgjP-like metallopeptidase domain-containing protein [Ferrimonas lipolytica]QIZ77732.1 M48 family metallopeptidase [Ferrimonas lipolytica]
MTPLRYLAHYPETLQQQVQQLIAEQRLGEWLRHNYPQQHHIGSDNALRDYIMTLKQQYMKKSGPLSKVQFDGKLHIVHNALGTHTTVSRVQGGKLKSKNEIRIGSMFKRAPEPLLRMISVHELAHLKEKQHDKNFYALCQHMLPNYHQLELATRMWLTEVELNGHPYQK